MAKFTDLPLSEQRRLIKESPNTSLSDIISAYDKENAPQSLGPSLTTTLPFSLENAYKSGGKIHIKPENKGKFTALKKRTGHSASWFKAHGTPAQKKMAVFALNARKWNHAEGGYLEDPEFVGPPAPRDPEGNLMNYAEMKLRQRYAESSFNDAIQSSPAGAVGRYQIMPNTLKEYVQRTGRSGDLNDPAFNEQVRDWYMENLNRYRGVKRGNPTPYVKAYRKAVGYNAGPGTLNKKLSEAEAAGIDIDNTIDWLSYMPKESQDYANWIVGGQDIPGTSKTAAEYAKAKKKYNILAQGGDGYTLPENFTYTPEVDLGEINPGISVNLSRRWGTNRDYYNQMVSDILSGQDETVNRTNFRDVDFTGRRRAVRKVRKALEKGDRKLRADEQEAWQQQHDRAYRQQVIEGLRNNTLSPEEFAGYTRYGIDKYGVPIAAPIVGGAVLGAVAGPVSQGVGAIGKYIPKAMEWSFNPVGAALRKGVADASLTGATTVAGMPVSTASMVAAGTDAGLAAVYGGKAYQEMQDNGVSAENATNFALSVVPALGIPAAAAYRYAKPLVEEMPSFRSLFTTSEKVGGNGITPWQSYRARQVLNPNSIFSKLDPYYMRNRIRAKETELNLKRAGLQRQYAAAEADRDMLSTQLRTAPAGTYETEADGLAMFYERALHANTPGQQPLESKVSSGGVRTLPLTYITDDGRVLSVDTPAFFGAGDELTTATAPEVFFPVNRFSSGKTQLGVSVIRSTKGSSQEPVRLFTPESSKITSAIDADIRQIEAAAGEDVLSVGSGAVARRYGYGAPGDYDLVTTRERWKRAAPKLGFKEDPATSAIGTPKGEIKFAVNGDRSVDVGMLEGDEALGVSWGKEAEEYYSLLHPEEFTAIRNQRALDNLYSSAGRFEMPISPEQLYQEIKANPDVIVKKTLMDNIVSGKSKHIGRMKSLIDFDPELVSAAIGDIHKSLYGREISFSQLYPNMSFTDTAANEAFLQKLQLPTSWAKDPKKMRATTELLEASLNSVTSGKKGLLADAAGKDPKSWIETLVDSGTSTNNFAGPGANAVQGSKWGGGQSYSNAGVSTVYRIRTSTNDASLKTPLDMFNAFERQLEDTRAASEHFTSEQLQNAMKVVNKYIPGRATTDFTTAATQEDIYNGLNSVQNDFINTLGIERSSDAMKEVTEALGLPSIRTKHHYFETDFRDNRSIVKGGYTGTFGSAKTSSGEPIYGMSTSPVERIDGIETPRVFTNKDLYPLDTRFPDERIIFQEQEETAQLLKDAFEARIPDASKQAKEAFNKYVDNFEKTFEELKGWGTKASKELRALEVKGVDINQMVADAATGNPSAEYKALSKETKEILKSVDWASHDTMSTSQLIQAINHWDKFKDVNALLREINAKDTRNAEFFNKQVDKLRPYLSNKDDLEFATRNVLLATLIGGAGVGATKGTQHLNLGDFSKDPAYREYVWDRQGEYNPMPKEVSEMFEESWNMRKLSSSEKRELRKSEAFQERRKLQKQLWKEWQKKNLELDRAYTKDYRNLKRKLKEAEKKSKK